jgi:glycerophosphoryl diester phosphodiesterase
MRINLFCIRLLLGTLTFSACSAPLIGQEGRASKECPRIVAHRAGAREAGVPDNSLAAIAAAVADGLEILEVDVRRSSDGEPFLFHDRRLTEGPWDVPERLLGQPFSSVASADLEKICVAGAQQRCLPPFSKALDSTKAATFILQIDLKDRVSRSDVQQLISDIMKRKLAERIVFFCDPSVECELVRDVKSDVRIMARVYQASDLTSLLSEPPWAVQVDESMLSHPLLGELRERGVLIMVKTLDEMGDTPEHWSKLREEGVDLILTDYPRAARRELCSAADPF